MRECAQKRRVGRRIVAPPAVENEMRAKLATSFLLASAALAPVKQPVEVSKAQIESFRKHYLMNARPVQPLNDRTVEQS